MHARDLASFAALSALALTIGVGCPSEPEKKPEPAKTAAAEHKEPKKEEPKKEEPAAQLPNIEIPNIDVNPFG